MLEARDVQKIFYMGDIAVHAVRGVSLKVHEGEFAFIVGPSGSGKTTLLDMLGALSHPTKGKMIIDGRQIDEFNDFQLSMFRRDRIGFIFQTFNLIPTLNAVDNVLVPMIPEKITPELRQRAEHLLTQMGLKERMHHQPNQLSGGERQRVAIARSLINDPVIVLADEPTGELDSKTGREVMDYMHRMNEEEGKTFVIVTHDTEYIRPEDKVYTMKDGLIHNVVDGKRRAIVKK